MHADTDRMISLQGIWSTHRPAPWVPLLMEVNREWRESPCLDSAMLRQACQTSGLAPGVVWFAMLWALTTETTSDCRLHYIDVWAKFKIFYCLHCLALFLALAISAGGGEHLLTCRCPTRTQGYTIASSLYLYLDIAIYSVFEMCLWTPGANTLLFSVGLGTTHVRIHIVVG